MNRHTRVEFYSRTDLKDLLEALDAANGGAINALPIRELGIYRKGFQDALHAVAAAAGFSLSLENGEGASCNGRVFEVEGPGPFLPESHHYIE